MIILPRALACTSTKLLDVEINDKNQGSSTLVCVFIGTMRSFLGAPSWLKINPSRIQACELISDIAIPIIRRAGADLRGL